MGPGPISAHPPAINGGSRALPMTPERTPHSYCRCHSSVYFILSHVQRQGEVFKSKMGLYMKKLQIQSNLAFISGETTNINGQNFT
jgi:hypothetical protein